MSAEITHTCQQCNQTFCSKHTLLKHLRFIHRISEDGTTVSELECDSEKCDYKTMYPAEMRKHLKKCNWVILDNALHEQEQRHNLQLQNTIQQVQSSYLQEITNLKTFHASEIAELKSSFDRQISRLEAENQILQTELNKSQKTVVSLSEQAINRPTTINQQHNEIGNVKITQHLADHDMYLAQTNPQHIKAMMIEHFESYFFDGQPGLARFVVDHIIRMSDGKLILCCTDPARKRFRFVDADKRLAEDMRAKMLCSKLSVPVREMCTDVFYRIIGKLNEEKRMKISTDAGAMEIDFLERKINVAHDRYIEIRSFDSDDNADFLNELTVLLRNNSQE